MLIDATFALLMVFAVIKGLRKGFIIALFSVAGFVIGIAAALKLSAVVAAKLSEHVGAGTKWLPVISFLIVFIAVVILVAAGARIIQKSIEMVMLGWANRIAGVLLFVLLYSILFSVFLFYAVQLNFIKPLSVQASIVYPYIRPLGPKLIDSLGIIIPFFKNMFTELQSFFGEKVH